jgi:hypothetical protein
MESIRAAATSGSTQVHGKIATERLHLSTKPSATELRHNGQQARVEYSARAQMRARDLVVVCFLKS